MKRTYDTGMNNNSIKLKVTVGTVGVAYSASYLLRTGGQWTQLYESNDENGNIPESDLGNSAFLSKSYIVIRTLIDLTHLDDDNKREMATKNLTIEYKFSGGFSGIQKYNFDNDDVTITPNKKLITIVKPIEMK